MLREFLPRFSTSHSGETEHALLRSFSWWGFPLACPENSRLRRAYNGGEIGNIPPGPSYIYDHLKTMDMCENPEWQYLHGASAASLSRFTFGGGEGLTNAHGENRIHFVARNASSSPPTPLLLRQNDSLQRHPPHSSRTILGPRALGSSMGTKAQQQGDLARIYNGSVVRQRDLVAIESESAVVFHGEGQDWQSASPIRWSWSGE